RAGARRAALVLVVVLGLGGLAGGLSGSAPARAGLAERVRHLGDGAGRRQVWRAAWGLFCDRPLCGWGPGGLRLAFGARRPVDYEPAEWNSPPTRAHNELLHVLATQGLLGGAALFILLAGLVRAARRAWRAAAPQDRPFLAALLASLTGFAVQDL